MWDWLVTHGSELGLLLLLGYGERRRRREQARRDAIERQLKANLEHLAREGKKAADKAARLAPR